MRGLATCLVVFCVGLSLFVSGCGRTLPSRDDRQADPAPGDSGDDAQAQPDSPPAVGSDTRATSSTDIGNRHEPLKESLSNLEGFSAAADKVLDEIGKCLGEIVRREEPHFPLALADDLQVARLRPANLVTAFEDSQLTVLRGSRSSEGRTGISLRSSGDLPQQLAALAEPYTKTADVRVKFKTFRVQNSPEAVSTQVYFHVTGETSAGVFEQSAIWRCGWIVPPGSGQPVLRSIDVSDYEEVECRDRPMFEEITRAVLEPSEVFDDQIRLGIPWLRSQFQAEMAMDMRGHQGLAVGDVNNDGLDDVYLCQPIGIPNRLFIQNEDGTVREASEAAGVNWLDSTRSALLLDLDNDGDQDLVVAMREELVIAKNTGQGRFEVVQRLDGPPEPRSLAAIDYDGDKLLDVYACAFWGFSFHDVGILKTIAKVPTPYHDAKNGPPNRFYRNQGGLVLREVTEEVGLDHNNRRFSHAAAWEDFDHDGDFDLYVANDYGRNNLYRSDDGRFVDVAADLNVEDIAASMSVTWGDVDHDGLGDLYVSNMFSSAGGRIAHQKAFQPKIDEDNRAGFQRHARGNTLFKSVAGQPFEDTTLDAGVVMGRWAWSSQFIDINNDSWEDLVVANGFMTNEDTGDL